MMFPFEHPAPDDVHPDALVDVAEVSVVRPGQAELDVRDRSGITRHRVAILPGATHYDINVVPALATTVAELLGELRV
jgi:hypothetical protein